MTSTTARWATPLLMCALLALGACGGGGGGTPVPGSNAFNLVLYADPDTGGTPLTVSFFAVPSNGVAPFSYKWDFNSDGVVDSNAPNGFFTFTQSAIAKVTVTDGTGASVVATKTITIVPVTPPVVGSSLDIRFTAEPTFGTVPFNVQFTSFVTGGTPPYQYSWDFENDGVFDNFTANPLFTYTKIGTKIANGQYFHFPVLKVTDNRGVTGTNLDDNNGDGNPDFRIAVNALPPGGGSTVVANANPANGQAPLTVEFTGSVTGGSGNFEYKWDFGDTNTTAFSASSLASHTYLQPGTYLAAVTVRDKATGEQTTSQNVTVKATPQQQLSLTINSDTTQGQVPFVANLSANPVNGKEPIQYSWDIFTDLTPTDPAPTVSSPGNPPGLDGAAIVTPDTTNRKNPLIHFANTANTNAAYSYVARCVATDANGNTAISNLIRIVANPNRTYPYYFAERPKVVGRSFFPVDRGGQTAVPQYEAITPPQSWSPHSNAAICSHPSGVSYMFGGEILDESGNFQSLVNRGNAMYMFLPGPGAGLDGIPGNADDVQGTGGTGRYGDINITGGSIRGTNITGLGGNFIRLNDGGAPPFPGPNDSPPQGAGNPPGPIPTQRALPPTIVGSAAAVFIHEPMESNPTGAYEGAGYPQPDAPGMNYGLGTMAPGIGSPIIYVLGGRTAATTPASQNDSQGNPRGLVQKYYVPDYGENAVTPWDAQYAFQSTGNQADIWSPFFERPDTDQWPDSMDDPQIQDRTPGGGSNAVLPTLPTPVYGLAAVALETGVTSPAPAFPFGPYRYIFTFGGVDATGSVLGEMRWWDTSKGLDSQGGSQGPAAGVFSLMPAMPIERAYAKAIVIDRAPQAPAVALVGGYDKSGAAIAQIDIFTFNDPLNPSTGSWSTFNGTLPEALVACGGGYNAAGGSDKWLLAMGGWTGSKFSESVFNIRLGSGIVIRQPLVVVPRRNMASSQAGGPVEANGTESAYGGGNLTFNRYYLFGGVDENGPDSIVEAFALP